MKTLLANGASVDEYFDSNWRETASCKTYLLSVTTQPQVRRVVFLNIRCCRYIAAHDSCARTMVARHVNSGRPFLHPPIELRQTPRINVSCARATHPDHPRPKFRISSSGQLPSNFDKSYPGDSTCSRNNATERSVMNGRPRIGNRCESVRKSRSVMNRSCNPLQGGKSPTCRGGAGATPGGRPGRRNMRNANPDKARQISKVHIDDRE